MAAPVLTSRRKFLAPANGAASVAAASLLVSGCGAAPNERRLVFRFFDDVQRELQRLVNAKPLEPVTAWSWSQTLHHGAQNIEFSMLGFPLEKPVIFQRTLGAAALQVFAWRGHMTHDLREPIPGAAALPAGSDTAPAVASVQRAIASFTATTAPSSPHFAYGDLDKASNQQAHAMRMANHFSAFEAG